MSLWVIDCFMFGLCKILVGWGFLYVCALCYNNEILFQIHSSILGVIT
jgi:hypothetical protein